MEGLNFGWHLQVRLRPNELLKEKACFSLLSRCLAAPEWSRRRIE
jgi:hypothetical protein